MSPSKRDQRINDILTGAKQILDTTKDPLGLIPIPGLPAAVSALSTIIGMILTAKGNDETREDLANNINELTSVIDKLRKKAESALRTNDDNLTRTRLVSSPELKERIGTLKRDLKGLANNANNLETGLLGLILSKKNTDTLLRIKTGIETATRKFQVQGGITIEMLLNGIVDDVEHIKRIQQQELDERALKDLSHVNAGYASTLNPTQSGTLPGTRTALLEELTEWCLRPDSVQDDSFIYFITGGAGTGKSTIAFEMAQKLDEVGALGASFFFIRGAEKFNAMTYVVATIAYQLAHSQADLYPHIAKAARDYIRRGKQGEQLQMDLDHLIIKPLMNVHSSHKPIILVFDALDECTKAAQEEVVRLLYLLMQRLPKIRFPVRILVTSRPEMHIQDALDDEDIRKVSKPPFKLHEIPRVIVDADIKLFLKARLKVLKCYKDVCNARPSVVEDLTEHAAGLFIYADTVVKFLARNPYHAVNVLEALLSDNPSDAAFSLENLDRLYIAILQNALDDTCLKIPHMKEYIQIVLGSLALLQDHMSAVVLQDLVDIPMRYIQDILGRLGSIILQPETDDAEIRMLHASFPQFLIDVQRCTDPKFYIKPSTHHRRLASTCLEVMTERHPLRRNICQLEDPTMMKSDTPGLYNINRCILPSLQYSCAHWATHLSHCIDPGRDFLNVVAQFMRTKLLVWVETLSYMGRLEVAVPALLAALSWCEANMHDDGKNEILQLIYDTHRLVLQCYTPINDCPEHLYISGCLLAPSCVTIGPHDNSNDKIPTIKSMTPRDSAWGPCLHLIPMNSVNCRAILSPDGNSIACGSRNGQVHIWDAGIGLSKRTLSGHTKGVLCVSWSPDGQSLASGSADGTIRVWNATSGAQIHIQSVQSRNSKVYVIAWRQDGRQVVAGVDPGGVELWDIVVGKELKRRVKVPTTQVMAISKDARHAVARTTRKLRLWNIERNDGRILKELTVKFLVYSAVFLHDDTQIAFCGKDNAIHLWDLESGKCIPKVRPKSNDTQEGETSLYGVALSKTGDILASSTIGGIHFFNTKSWNFLGSLPGGFYLTASFSPDNRRLLTSEDTIDMLDLTSVLARKPLTIPSTPVPIIKHESAITFVVISLDGERVATKSRATISIWSLKSGSLLCIFQGYFVGGTTFSPDTQKIAVGERGKICIWNITTTQPTLIQSIPTAHSNGDVITWSLDGRWIAGAAHGPDSARGLGVFDAITGKLVKYLVLSNEGVIRHLEFSQDNNLLYVRCGLDETIFKWKEGEQVNFEQHGWET